MVVLGYCDGVQVCEEVFRLVVEVYMLLAVYKLVVEVYNRRP